ncbi:FAD binding domain-containing protein [Phytoactinopolyspora limicola]|uniref:FAD binding domain-containing protein n=1 Tax=Phytoactinopolyspora limicola TaxID=2715536 RepID=UPI001407F306|nr:xanthine dehydrogenase family protein subunit M [Phytoactinopolyspora limicola]
MKPSPFTYHRPGTTEAAVGLLTELGTDAKVLAGGQSLVPLLNMRLAAPPHLVDINQLQELNYVRATGTSPDGAGPAVVVGAAARHADVERDPAAHQALPLLRRALRHVAHPTIRNRGTTVGSIVHADPAGEMTAVLALLDGSVELRSANGSRRVGAADFFVGPLESAAEPGELAVSATFPVPPGQTGTAWLEVARRHGDYAVCGVGALVTVDADHRVVGARAAYISVDTTPVVLDLLDAVGTGPADTADWSAAGRLAASTLRPDADIHATAEYRRHLAAVLTGRALTAAALDARGRGVNHHTGETEETA